MFRSPTRRAIAVVPFAVAAAILAGCSGLPNTGGGASNDAAATKFIACLTAAGQTAKIIEGGQVGLLMPEAPQDEVSTMPAAPVEAGGDGGAVLSVAMFQDEEGMWLAGSGAEAYPEDGGMRKAWAGCEEEVPEFEQPSPDFSGADFQTITREDMIEASLAFAECARGEGYADFADPDANGMLDFPFGMSEDSFRSLLEACFDDESGLGVPISAESAESFEFDWLAVMQEFGTGMGFVSSTTEVVE